jgi:predicted nucleic acid-binding protein
MDAPTAILLAKVELLDLFVEDVKGRVMAPPEVAEECGGRDSLDARIIARAIWEGRILVKAANRSVTKRLLSDFGLDPGEAAALALALDTPDVVVATDDRRAINGCKVLRLPFVTAITVWTRLHAKEILSRDQAARKLAMLIREGRYSGTIVAAARRNLGIQGR